jgi:hypothetical protein
MTAFTGAAFVPATAGAVLGMHPATASASPAAPSGSPKVIAQKMIEDNAQFACIDKIVSHESDWDVDATNTSSGAYGLVQALPGSKMASAGTDWRPNAATRIEWGPDYMKDRYGSPCGAWSSRQAQGWY